MRRSFLISLITYLIFIISHNNVISKSLFYDTYEWIEDFNETSGLKFWFYDEGDDWRIFKKSQITSFINNIDNNNNNLLSLELDPSFSQALYFQPLIQNDTENAKLSIFITVLGCNSNIELYWKGRSVLKGPTKCPENMWIPLEFNTFLTEFDAVDILLLITGPLNPDLNPLLFISRLDVILKFPSQQAPFKREKLQQRSMSPALTTDASEYGTDFENTNSSSNDAANLSFILICATVLRVVVYNLPT